MHTTNNDDGAARQARRIALCATASSLKCRPRACQSACLPALCMRRPLRLLLLERQPTRKAMPPTKQNGPTIPNRCFRRAAYLPAPRDGPESYVRVYEQGHQLSGHHEGRRLTSYSKANQPRSKYQGAAPDHRIIPSVTSRRRRTVRRPPAFSCGGPCS